MSGLPKNFFIGASTAAHQVEGNNIYSDFWTMEQMEYSSFSEPSLDAVEHYHHFKEDIELLAEAGLNAYRFSIEWARIEPERGRYDEAEIAHYREVLECCRANGVEPIVTMHHFSSPKWLIAQGGWESEATNDAFAGYCAYVVERLGAYMHYVCTINEANMGLQMAAIVARYKKLMQKSASAANIQVGVNMENPVAERMKKQALENLQIFGTEQPQIFLGERTEEGDKLIMRAHQAAKAAMKHIRPELQIGITLSLHDIQPIAGGEKRAQEEWKAEFVHYIPYIKDDDFLGVQNYTRTIMGPEGAELTQMGYEFYPQALGNVIRAAYKELPIPILITENGIGTENDERRIEFIKEALAGVESCAAEGIPMLGYLHWSLLDNFEWQKGFSKTFGLIAVDRKTQKRYPKESIQVLGRYTASKDT